MTKKDEYRAFLDKQLGWNGANTMEVMGESMMPTLRHGDHVKIDTSDCFVSSPGIFAVWDGNSIFIRWLEVKLGTRPRIVMVMADNPSYINHEIPEEELYVLGRVLAFGRWL